MRSTHLNDDKSDTQLPTPLPVVSFSQNGISVSILPIEVRSTSLEEKKVAPVIVPPDPPKIQIKSTPAFAVKVSPGEKKKSVKPFLSNGESKTEPSLIKEPAFSVQGLLPNFGSSYKTASPSRPSNSQASDISAAETVQSKRVPAFSIGALLGNSEGTNSSNFSTFSSQRSRASVYDSSKTFPSHQKAVHQGSQLENDSALSAGELSSPSAARRSGSRVTFAQNLHAPASPPTAMQLAFGDRAQQSDERGIACGTPSSPREMECEELSLSALAPPPDRPRSEADFMAHWLEQAARRFERHLEDAGVALTPAQRQHERRRFLESVRAEARELWRARPAPEASVDEDAEPFPLTLSALSAAVA